MILSAHPHTGLSQVIRWHADAWRLPGAKDLSCIVFGLSDDSARGLAGRDVFGRLAADADSSFYEWSNYVGIVPATASLSELLASMAGVCPCPVETWRTHARKASVVPNLRRAVSEGDIGKLKEIVPEAERQDWDAVCTHAEANRIKELLRAVTSGVTPDWEQTKAILASLKRNE